MSQELADEISKEFKEISGLTCSAVFLDKGVKHQPTELNKEKEKGVYVFLISETCCFKVGKAGSKSAARWNSHHYNLDKSTPSTFTKSFLSDIPNFSQYFEGKAKSELWQFHSTLTRHLGGDFTLTKKFLKNVSVETFKPIKVEINVKNWVRTNLSRIELKIVDGDNRDFDIDLLEKMVAFKLRPLYEGSK